MDQEPRSEQSRRDLASAHFRLAHINRMLGRPDAAADAYEQAIAHFESLARAYPRRADYRGGLANAFNWLGETRRAQAGRAADAGRAYDAALRLQEQLVREYPATAQYAADLARTLYNRGILRATTRDEPAAAERDFREAIRLLEPLAATDDSAAQGLARTYNNLAGLLVFEDGRAAAARALYEQAIATHEQLVRADPDHREYRFELAKFCNNLAALLLEQGQFDSANERSRQALDLIEGLAQLPPSLAVERADAHTLRAVVLQAHDPAGAEQEYRAALDRFAEMPDDPDLHQLPDFHLRFGDLLVNLAGLSGRTLGGDGGRPLLARGVRLYGEVVAAILASGSSAEARNARETLSRVLPVLPETERDSLTTLYRQLEQTIGANGGPQGTASPRAR
jgi:tetratricopeptide (TPR) repeat protein